jgi:hypothetical protein
MIMKDYAGACRIFLEHVGLMGDNAGSFIIMKDHAGFIFLFNFMQYHEG